MESQGTSSIYNSLILASMQSLVLITKWRTIQTIINIREKTATLKRRPNWLHEARVKRMI
jgi:hypothetical protein